MPNRPIATGTKPMPSDNSGMPNAKRWKPEFTSVPIETDQQTQQSPSRSP